MLFSAVLLVLVVDFVYRIAPFAPELFILDEVVARNWGMKCDERQLGIVNQGYQQGTWSTHAFYNTLV